MPTIISDQEKFDLAVKMAKYYLCPFSRRTLKNVSEKFGRSQSNVSKYFKVWLPKCNPKLAERVAAKSARMLARNQKKFAKRIAKNSNKTAK